MASPSTVTSLDLSGKFGLNKAQSDDLDEMFRLQGLGWMTRKAIGLATVTIFVKHYKNDAGVEQIDIEQTLTGGIKGTKEVRILEWKDREHEDHIFGAVVGKSRRILLAQVEDRWLKEGWLDEINEHGAIENLVITNPEKNTNSWSLPQVWGFADVGGERKYVRSLVFAGPKGEQLKSRLVYDYRPL